MACAALLQQVLGEAQREARFQDVVDQQDLAVAHVVDDVAHDAHPAAGLRAAAVARQSEEIHRPVGAGAAQRADEVGREHEAALQHRDDQGVGRKLGGEFCRHFVDAGGDFSGGEADRDGRTVGHGQCSLFDGRHDVGRAVGRIVEWVAEAQPIARCDRTLDHGIGAFAQDVVALAEDQLERARRSCRATAV